MNCRTAEPLVSALVDNELTGDEAVRLRNHMRFCDKCRALYEESLEMKSSLRTLKTHDPPCGLESRLKASLQGRARGRRPLALAGALICAGLAAASLAVILDARSTPRPQPVAATTTSSWEADADRAYLGGSDPMSGGVPVVAVGYAGGN